MSDRPMLTPAQLEEMTGQLARILPSAILDRWEEIRLSYAGVADETSVEFVVVRGDGTRNRLNPPYRATRLLRDLREGMYRPGRGTWFTARFEFESGDAPRVSYDYDTEPVFGLPVPPRAWAEDLRRFPRDPDAIPPWLSERLAVTE